MRGGCPAGKYLNFISVGLTKALFKRKIVITKLATAEKQAERGVRVFPTGSVLCAYVIQGKRSATEHNDAYTKLATAEKQAERGVRGKPEGVY